ncbi:hypothetical protein HOY82DRAFT_540640 [Tuber indicum]|nr:hypothetical protein HOY82DRAFT_540640 [Tuber indicum]
MDDIDELLNIGLQQSQINKRKRTTSSRTPWPTNFALGNPYQRILRHITSHEWNSKIRKNKWWPQIFHCLCSLFKDMQDKTFMSIHVSLLEEDQNLYPASSTQFISQNNSDLDVQPIGENELLETFPEDYENYSDIQRIEAMDMEYINNGLDDILSDLN